MSRDYITGKARLSGGPAPGTGEEDVQIADGVDFLFGDGEELQFGDASGGDVSVKWTGSLLQISPAADDTGSINVGDGTSDIDFKLFLGAATDYALFDVGNKALSLAGDVRIDLSSCTVAAANTDGGVIKAGTSGSPVTEDTADMKFISLYFDNGATSGDNRGIYNRLYLTGAGGGGESLRSFTTVNDVAGGTAHGAHLSLNFGSTGSVTGLGIATRSTLHIANQAYTGLGGTYAAVQAEIWSDGADSDPVGMTELSFIRVVNGGDSGGIADVDDDAFLMVFSGMMAGAGNMISAAGNEPTWTAKTHKIRCKLPDGTTCYLIAVID